MKNIFRFAFPAILTVMCLLTACNNEPAGKDQKTAQDSAMNKARAAEAEAMAGNFSNQRVFHFDSAAIQSFLNNYPDFKIFSSDLHSFYGTRNYSYAWYDSNGLIEQAASLHNRFLQLANQGIFSKLIYQGDFNALMDDTDSSLMREPMNAEAELMLTSQYFNYARNVWQGMGENQSKKLDWFLPRKKLDLQSLMDSLLNDTNKQFIATEPVYRQYGLLRSFLEKYRAIEKSGEWPIIKSDKKSYKPGDSSAVISQIRKRLFITDDITNDNHSMIFDKELEEGIRNFQRRNGLKEDGVAGPAFVNEMSKPLTKLIEQIIVNMERCRWVPANPTGEYLVVNIPAYKLYIYKSDTLLWDMNIVAGKPVHKTTVFNGNISNIVFSPYWNVPPGILNKEVLPGIRRDRNYLKKHNMEMNGNQVRQKPGPNNSLGLVKFLFPNSYSIYMHDTPSKNLFKEDKRAFSHGCIRLAEPKKLAMYLLRNYPEWTEEKIDAAMNSGKEKYVTLKETVPVFIAYFTAWVDRYGKLNIRQDIYDRDDRIANMLLERK